MNGETAEGYLNGTLFPDNRESTLLGIYQVRHYGDLRAQEEREKLLAELRSEKAWRWLERVTDDFGLAPEIKELEKFMQRCKQEGQDEAKAEIMADWRSTDPTIRKALKAYARLPKGQFDGRVDFHTTCCGVHQSKECDCGGN